MKFCFYTNSVSPHQLPLARELIARLGKDDYRYVFTTPITENRKRCGWSTIEESWIVQSKYGEGAVDEMLETCDVLMSGVRTLDLFEKRAVRGVKTLYVSERWFRPVKIVRLFGLFDCSISGWMRMLHPGFRRMAKRFVRWMNSDPNARCLAIGSWAKRDMLRIGVDESKIVPWGYFVAPSDYKTNSHGQHLTSASSPLKILWVGRMIHWKRVDTIIRAVAEVEKRGGGEQRKIQLTLVGDGSEKPCLQRLADHTLRKVNNSIVNLQPQPDTVTFLPSQPIDKIREIMRSHDVYVLASNAQEGWGAALNEALEEGMFAIGTCEAGASASMLSPEWLFHSGDWRRLADLIATCAEMKLEGVLLGQGIGEWSATRAAERLLAL